MVQRIMADWLHKVRSYEDRRNYSINEYPGRGGNFNDTEYIRNYRDEKSIEEWLDWQCEGGWELFKFHPQGWCVFRKQI